MYYWGGFCGYCSKILRSALMEGETKPKYTGYDYLCYQPLRVHPLRGQFRTGRLSVPGQDCRPLSAALRCLFALGKN